MNLNPIASGNKTQSGIGGLLSLALGAAVMAVLKQMGIDDTTGAISGAVTSAAVSGGLFIVGLVHKVFKGEHAATVANLTIKAMASIPVAPSPAPVSTSIDPAPVQPTSVPEKQTQQ